jgi:hypothetical protein
MPRIAPAVLVVLASLLIAPAAHAASFAVQGVLRANTGGPAADGTYVIWVSLYDAEKAKDPLWSKGYKSVDVQGGLFGITVGAEPDPVPDAILANGKPLWLGVSVGSDPELPREKVLNVPRATWAMVAGAVECSGCIAAQHISDGAVTGTKVGFTYAGSKSKGGPAEEALTAQVAELAKNADKAASAEELKCTGCITPAHLHADVKAAFVSSQGGKIAGDLTATGKVSAAAFVGDGSGLTGLSAATPNLRGIFDDKDKEVTEVEKGKAYTVKGQGFGSKPALYVWNQAVASKSASDTAVVAEFAEVPGEELLFVSVVDGTTQRRSNMVAVHWKGAPAGDGSDGDLTVLGKQIVNVYGQPDKSVEIAATSFGFKDPSGFKDGDEVLLIQSRGVNAGNFAFAHIQLASNQAKMDLGLPFKCSMEGGDRCQIVRVPQFKSVSVQSGNKLVAKPWDGERGGILVFRAQGTVSIDSGASVDVSGLGFRGGNGGPDKISTGYQGESYAGSAVQSINPLYGGGGGGTSNPLSASCCVGAGGGGGGYANSGGNGQIANYANEKAGLGGAAYGTADLMAILFGSGGGGGGKDQDGGYAGQGGSGGGIAIVFAAEIKGGGDVISNGIKGQDGGAGGENGGGGGGAGGSIWLSAKSLAVKAKAAGAGGGKEAHPSYPGLGGTGSVGRIRFDCAVCNATADPTASFGPAPK